MVVCQPGNSATEKSRLMTECTDSTSGVASPASSSEAVSYRTQCRTDPRQPTASIPYTNCPTFEVERSRSVPRSGIMPRYQNTTEMVAYVETANTSHSSGDRNCGQKFIVLGYGNNQYPSHGLPT